MTLFSSILLSIAGGVLLLGIWLRRGRRGFVEVNPRYRELLQQEGLIEAGDFLDVRAVIVSGHPDRNVAQLTLGDGPAPATFYLKREERVSWVVRLTNALAGFGFTSLSLREACLLRALPHAGIDGPEWVAVGEDRSGRAFLLLRSVSGAVELRSALAEDRDVHNRRQLARVLGAALAKVHDAGYDHPDLYAKHVLVDPASLDLVFLDWQRSCRRRNLSLSIRGAIWQP